WSRKECIVKQECPTYGAANTAMKTLMTRHLSPNSSRTTNHPLCNENGNRITQQSKISIGVSDVVASEPPAKQELPESKTSMLVSIKMMVETLMKRQALIEEQNARIVNQNANIEEQNARIKKQKSELLKKLESIQKRCKNRCSQYSDLVDKSMTCSSFDFDPVETIEQLLDLENKLNDETFRSKMVTWLKFNVVGTQSKKRMSSCLNLLVSRDVLAYCSWTGIVRNGVKQLAIKDMQHMLELFQEIGTTPWEKVNDRMVATFFKAKVKNAQQRVQSQNKCEKEENTINSRDFPQQPLDHADLTDHVYTESMDEESEMFMIPGSNES
uniref:DUF4806 domain-containing protein n=2 Tax=Anopheles albimanus TaxID=7167 RepID=A0A8W7K7J9_ANOAL